MLYQALPEKAADSIYCSDCKRRVKPEVLQSRLYMRKMAAEDAAAIAQLMRRVTVLHAKTDKNLETILSDLIQTHTIVGVVVEQSSTANPARPTLIGVTFSGFLAADFARHYRAAPSALLTSQCLASRGGTDPLLLDRKAQAAANRSEGLDLVILEMAVALNDPASQAYREVLHMLYGAHLEFLRGFNIRSIMTEASEEFEPLIVGTGLRTASRHKLDGTSGQVVAPPGRSPNRCLFAITREELGEVPASSAAALVMTYVQPHMRLTLKEQDFLSLAIMGLTDAALAEELGISTNTVKQTWRNIYDHCLEVMPEIFATEPSPAKSTSRGQEKRRSVLVYIRNNLQELRPHHLRRR